MTLKRIHNIIYFNVFRFHCFGQFSVAIPIFFLVKRVGLDSLMSLKYERRDWDAYLVKVLNDPKGGISLFLTDRFMGMLYASVALTAWNLFCGLLQLEFSSWKFGLVLIGVVGLIAIFVIDHDYLSDFREFESWSVNEKRKFLVITLLTVGGILYALVASLFWYFSFASR